MDLPDILDLPNLPTDLSYMTDLGPGIAPSVQNVPEFLEDSIPEDAEALLLAPPPPPPQQPTANPCIRSPATRANQAPPHTNFCLHWYAQ